MASGIMQSKVKQRGRRQPQGVGTLCRVTTTLRKPKKILPNVVTCFCIFELSLKLEVLENTL